MPIGSGRSLSAPAVLGQLLTELAPAIGERALVVGSGSGYSASVLSAMGAEVTALESDPELAAAARANSVATVEGKLEQGSDQGAPYDLILIDGAIAHIPTAFIAQLSGAGRIGGALIDRGITRLSWAANPAMLLALAPSAMPVYLPCLVLRARKPFNFR